MWKKTVTIDKAYEKERRALLKELDKNKSLMYAVEESKSRTAISVAARETEAGISDDYVCDRVAKLLTTYFKHSFLMSELGLRKVSAAQASLISVMVYYDCESDYAEIFDKLKEYEVISVDGVFNFAMRDIKEDWRELAAISENLFDDGYGDDDLYEVAGYVVDEKADRARLLIADAQNPVVTDIAKGCFVGVDEFYGDKVLDLINCVVGKGAAEVTLDASFGDKTLISALSRFARVRRI